MHSNDEQHGKHDGKRKMNILKRRYARGEIPAEQFEAMKRQLAES